MAWAVYKSAYPDGRLHVIDHPHKFLAGLHYVASSVPVFLANRDELYLYSLWLPPFTTSPPFN